MIFTLCLISFGIYLGQEYTLPSVKILVTNLVTYITNIESNENGSSGTSQNDHSQNFNYMTNISYFMKKLLLTFTSKSHAESQPEID